MTPAGDDEAAGMFPAEDDDEVMRPRRLVRSIVPSDDEGDNDDGGADDSFEVDSEHPPGTMAVFDEIAPVDANNPCEFSLIW